MLPDLAVAAVRRQFSRLEIARLTFLKELTTVLKELFIHVCILSQQRENNYSVVLSIDGMQTKAEVQTFAVAESSSGEIFSCIVYEILGTGDPVFRQKIALKKYSLTWTHLML